MSPTSGLAAGSKELDGVQSVTARLRARVLVPLGVAVVLCLAIGAGVLARAQQHHLEHDAADRAQALHMMLEQRTESHVSEMQTLMRLMMGNDRLQAAFRRGDRQDLLKAAAPLLAAIRRHNQISHLYFIRPDRTVLLRVHRPESRDDQIDRYVLQRAQQTGEAAWGYEQGPYGSYTLRVSIPWHSDGQLLGFLEMGVEFEDLLSNIRRALGGELLVALDKTRVDRAQWTSAQQGKPRPAAWDEHPTMVLLSRTLDVIPGPVARFLAKPATPGDDLFRMHQDGRILATLATPLRNARGEPVGELVMIHDRTEEHREALASVLAAVGLCGLIAAGMMLFLHGVLGKLQRNMADRAARLANAQHARQQAEEALALQQERNGLLEARNRMVEELEHARQTAEAALQRNEEVAASLVQAQSELMASAREAGRAEIATNVLHNVGNVLNSVNISAGVIGAGLRSSRLAGLARAMELMAAHAGDLGDYLAHDEKGRLLPAYLAAAVKALDQDRQEMLEELNRLVKSIDHIKDIVATQQAHAAVGSVIEPVQPTELAEDALRMQGTSIARHQLTVVREYDDMPPVPLDRGRVLQILVNLISNAKTAMSGMQPDRLLQLTVSVRRMDDRLHFCVRDQGEGIPPENLTRIFAHGFTTRKTGHGFGLHSSALAARELGGTLTAASEGPGQGALFTLDLPLRAVAADPPHPAVATG